MNKKRPSRHPVKSSVTVTHISTRWERLALRVYHDKGINTMEVIKYNGKREK